MDDSHCGAAIEQSSCTIPANQRIVYDRKFLLKCRESEYSKNAPSDLPEIPGVTVDTGPRTEQRFNGGEQRLQPPLIPDRRPDVYQFDLVFPSTPPKVPLAAWDSVGGHGPLAQYRRRQSIGGGINEDEFIPPEYFFHPPMHHGLHHPRGSSVLGPAPIPPNSPLIPPSVLMIHPLQGPSGLITEQNCITSEMSKLSIWRKSHARNEIPDVQGYTTAKTPQLRTSFSSMSNVSERNRRYSVPDFKSSPIAAPSSVTSFDQGPSLGDSAYHSHQSISNIMSEDPSIVAIKQTRQMAGDSYHAVAPMSISF